MRCRDGTWCASFSSPATIEDARPPDSVVGIEQRRRGRDRPDGLRLFGVGLTAIREARQGDAPTVADIGKKLRAGTNCGSCIPEMRAILERVTEPA